MTQKPLKLGPLGSLVGYHLRIAVTVFAPDFRKGGRTGKQGIRAGMTSTLSVISANPGVNQSSIADALGIKRANMVSLINDLVEQGFISRVVVKGDRRARSLTLTAAGRAKLRATMRVIRTLEDQVLVGFSKEEQRILLKLLVRISERKV